MSDQETREVLLAIGRLEGKVDAHQQNLKSTIETVGEHDKRLREVENRWAWVLGAAAVISFSAPYILNLLHK